MRLDTISTPTSEKILIVKACIRHAAAYQTNNRLGQWSMYKSISFGTFWEANVMTIVRLPKMMAKKESQTIGAKPTSRSDQAGFAPILSRKLL